MERAVCERCGHFQPADWSPGDLCVACGAAVRPEVRCAWCAGWVPAAAYCRSCGCEVAAPERYAAARMLKSAGVDRFSLPKRLRDLDPEQALNLTRIYNAQLAVVSRRVEEVRCCESCLLQKGFSRRLEEELVPQLPLDKDRLAALAVDPLHSSQTAPRRVAEIAEQSPISFTRTLAGIALLRLGNFEGASSMASEALFSADAEVALEAALAFGHWRVRASLCDGWSSASGFAWAARGRSIDRWRLALIAGSVPWGSPLRPWAAVTVTLAWFGEAGLPPDPHAPVRARPAGSPRDAAPPDWLQAELQTGLAARDPDLRFSCALSLGEESAVVPFLDSGNAQQKAAARRCLALRNSEALAPYLLDASEEIRREIVNDLDPPLPARLIEPVLQIACRSSGSLRRSCLQLLAHDLNEEIVDRLIRAGCAEKDPELFQFLLAADHLPGSREVMRAILKAGLLGALAGPLRDAAGRVDFGDSELVRLAERSGAAAIETLVEIASAKIQKERWSGSGQPDDAGRFLARVAFSGLSDNIRARAYSELRSCGVWGIFTATAIRDLFGGTRHFAPAILEALRKPEPAEMVLHILEQLSEHWAEVAETFTADRHSFTKLVDSTGRLARDDSVSTMCREEAGRLLAALAVAQPKRAMPALAAVLRERGLKYEHRHIAEWLLAAYESFGPKLKGARRLAVQLADALAGVASGGSDPALNLLNRLADEDPALREFISARLGPAPDDFLAGFADGSSSEPADGDVSEEPEPHNDDLDHAVLMPAAPLKTLAEYVSFMKAMAQSENPLSVMARHGMTQESFVTCVSAWGDALGKDNRLALRYVELMRPETEASGSPED